MTRPESTCDVPVTSTDFYPTMLAMAGSALALVWYDTGRLTIDSNQGEMLSCVINKVGMERAGYPPEAIAEVRKAFRILFMRELRLEEAVKQVEEEFGESENVQLLIESITSSQRGLARPESATFEINLSE